MVTTTQFSHPSGWSAVTGELKYRGKIWTRTAGYSSMPKPELPVNPYNDSQTTVSQQVWGGWTRMRKSDGVVETVVPAQYPYYASTIRDWHFARYSDAGVDALISAMVNETTLKALVKTADVKSNLLVSLKEAAKTSDLILDTADRLFKAYRSFRRGNFRDVARHLDLNLRTVHNNWLAYKYGWTPLLLEVKGAAEFLAQQSVGRRSSFTVSASELDSYAEEWVVPDTIVGGPWNQTDTLTGEVRVRVKLWLELTSPHFSATQQLGITNPLLYAWEVIPFSFVFDWFISVGDYLTGLTALNGVNVKKAMVSIAETSHSLHVKPDVASRDDGTYLHTIGGRTSIHDRRNYNRYPIVVNPLSLYPPVARSQGSFTRMITSLALMRGQMRGFEKKARL